MTGASGGIGRDIARALHGAGAAVALSGTRREALEALAAELGARVHVLPCDSRRQGRRPKSSCRQAEAALGGLDILVNNAGITRDMLFMRMKDEDWDTVMNVNLTAAFRLSRAALRGHDEQALRPHHRDHLGRRRDRQSRAGQLRRRQGRA